MGKKVREIKQDGLITFHHLVVSTSLIYGEVNDLRTIRSIKFLFKNIFYLFFHEILLVKGGEKAFVTFNRFHHFTI